MHRYPLNGYDKNPPVRITKSTCGRYRLVWRTMFNGERYVPHVNDLEPTIDTLLSFCVFDANGKPNLFFSSYSVGMKFGLGIPMFFSEHTYIKSEKELFAALVQQMNP